MRRHILLGSLVVLGGGCATTFYGSPLTPGGPAGCQAKCTGWGMELSGMVSMGEYSDGCIRSVRGQPRVSAGAAAPAGLAAIASMTDQMARRQTQPSQ